MNLELLKKYGLESEKPVKAPKKLSIFQKEKLIRMLFIGMVGKDRQAKILYPLLAYMAAISYFFFFKIKYYLILLAAWAFAHAMGWLDRIGEPLGFWAETLMLSPFIALAIYGICLFVYHFLALFFNVENMDELHTEACIQTIEISEDYAAVSAYWSFEQFFAYWQENGRKQVSFQNVLQNTN